MKHNHIFLIIIICILIFLFYIINNILKNIEKYDNNTLNNNNIIIYPHIKYDKNDGGINVMYYLGKLLEESGKNVRMYPSNGIVDNPHFNKYYENDFNLKDCIIIYCEGTQENPLNGNYIVRWLLSPLGLNVKEDSYLTWGKKDLVYYFNYEERFDDNSDNKFKLLPLIIIFPEFTNNNKERNNKSCHTFRKSHYHKNIQHIHTDDSFEIGRGLNHTELVQIFNEYTYFYSYDPLTFLSINAALCGCISIVYPIEGRTKLDWLKITAAYPYLKENNLDNLYGIAYGVNDIEYAKSTIHLVKQQWDDIISFTKTKYLNEFINDINNFDSDSYKNRIENIFFK